MAPLSHWLHDGLHAGYGPICSLVTHTQLHHDYL